MSPGRDDDGTPYRADRRDSGWCVVSATGRVVMSCADERSAGHYASLLEQAWRDGYRAGYAQRGDPEA